MRPRHVALLIVGMLILIIAQTSIDHGSGSTYSYLPRGARAFALLLEREGFEVKSLREPFSALVPEPTNSTLFVVGQSSFGSSAKLLDWVRAGNRVVLLSDKRNSSLIMPGLLLPSSEGRPPWKVDAAESVAVTCALGAVECEQVSALSKTASYYSKLPDGWRSVVATADGEHLLVQANLEKGEIWLFPDTAPILNMHIDRHDNLELLFGLASQGDSVVFDEFHHGYIEPTAQHLTMKRDAVIILIVFVLFVLVFSGLSRSMRFGPPKVTPLMESSSSVEFATVLGLLYQENGLSALLRHYLTAWKTRVELVFGINRGLPTKLVLEELLNQRVLSPETARLLSAELARLETTQESLSEQELETLRVTLESIFHQPQAQTA